jgi:Protein of unknown function (DUF3455)
MFSGVGIAASPPLVTYPQSMETTLKRFTASVLLSIAAVPGIAAISEPAGIAPKLRPSGEQPAFFLNAQGVQIYTCQENPDYSYAWHFVAPEAKLLADGTMVGHHFAGPTWESTTDGSSVKGVVRARQDAGPGNAPWLLLAATPNGSDGRFAGVTSILRVATQGGGEPAETCNGSTVGKEARVPYTANYYFYKRT